MLYHQKIEEQQYITRKTEDGKVERPRLNNAEQQCEMATASRRRRKGISFYRTRKSPVFSLPLTLTAHSHKKTRDDRTRNIARRPLSETASQKTKRVLLRTNFGSPRGNFFASYLFYSKFNQSISNLQVSST
ncbi:hypothetical protein M9H77_12983 [Catharanthus roseus]|uniref:Uncharacterized protein n=1 Tax=Catharanthus roseus TaxID=4058 RepID=A0ACC0BIV8_CATRO|nr:hypothetical protein M9H77_12983 [Catharanthus roseus]